MDTNVDRETKLREAFWDGWCKGMVAGSIVASLVWLILGGLNP